MTIEQNAQPIRVAQMMTDMNYGGVEMVVMNYYRHMDRSRVQFDFFALEGSTLPQREEIERLGGRVYVVPKYTHLPQYEREIGRLFRQNGYQMIGNFHSHPESPSRPSEEDKRLAFDPNIEYLILSLMEEGNPVLKAFGIDREKNVTIHEIEITE